MARKTRLTNEIIDAIAQFVEAGTYPYIAAQAVGIPKSTFYDWMRLGESGKRPFSDLSAKVRSAHATARCEAETRVFQEKPLEWLRLGPGRSRSDEPGWTEMSQTEVLVDVYGPLPIVDQSHPIISEETAFGAIQVMVELGFVVPGPKFHFLTGDTAEPKLVEERADGSLADSEAA